MSDAYVIMTALPPTKGHLELIQFASLLTDSDVHVLINTQPCEPFPQERFEALRDAVARCGLDRVEVHHIHRTLDQDPDSPGFWDMWKGIYLGLGIQPGDFLVASEAYGQTLAELTDARFFPYDIDRSINTTKATLVRENPYLHNHFSRILPEFQHLLRPTVTVFGAESCGKTTLSKELANIFGGWWIHEYARPFLENTSTDINVQSMTDIWTGQAATQRQARNLYDRPIVIQDTDLFSTVGYWNFPHWDQLGDAPQGLIDDAIALKSDLYLVVKSNIPFEEDPLRYGGDEREGTDDYWLQVCKDFDLPYVAIEASGRWERISECMDHLNDLQTEWANRIRYDRGGF